MHLLVYHLSEGFKGTPEEFLVLQIAQFRLLR